MHSSGEPTHTMSFRKTLTRPSFKLPSHPQSIPKTASKKKLTFYLLDINYEIIQHQPQVRLWGVTEQGERVLVLDESFSPYFYLTAKRKDDLNNILRQLEEEKEENRRILKVEPVKMRFYGETVSAAKVTCRSPEDLETLSIKLSHIDGVRDHLEDDIRFSVRYLIDSNLKPCSWHEVDVEESPAEKGVTVSKVLKARAPPKLVDMHKVPPLRILAFSLTRYSEQGSPRPSRDPIVAISVSTDNGESKQFAAKELDDKTVIRSFIKYIAECDPDIILGYGSGKSDWPYLIDRCKSLKIPLKVDRSGGEPHTSLYGHISITGRASLDLYDMAEDMLEVKVKTLDNIARFLGLKTVEERIEEFQVLDFWKESQKRKRLLSQGASDAELILKLGENLLEYAEQLATITGIPLDQVEAAAVGFRVDSYLTHEAHRLGELIPRHIEQVYMRYRGSIVYEPKKGIHENVAVLDFSSMYPNLMILYNISPDTLVIGTTSTVELFLIPEVGHKFRKSPLGLYTTVLTSLIDSRRAIRQRLKSLPSGTTEQKTLREREKAIKVVTNAVYGYAGWTGARWYVREVAESAAALGRATIQKVVSLAGEEGLELIYGDTDSLFLRNDESKIAALLSRVQKELKLEIRAEKVYSRILFTEAKKKYAGLLQDGSLDIVGMEVVRGDWSEIARIVQEEVLSTLLRDGSAAKAANVARKAISELRNEKVPITQLIIWKTLTKSVNAYEVHAPHVEAAKILKKKGFDLTLGDKIGYVIVKGEGKLYERVKPYTLAKPEEIDREYYVQNQVIPSAMRVLADFGVKEEDLAEVKSQPSLAEYL